MQVQVHDDVSVPVNIPDAALLLPHGFPFAPVVHGRFCFSQLAPVKGKTGAVAASQQVKTSVPTALDPLFCVLAGVVPSPDEQSTFSAVLVFPVHLPVTVVQPAYGASIPVQSLLHPVQGVLAAVHAGAAHPTCGVLAAVHGSADTPEQVQEHDDVSVPPTPLSVPVAIPLLPQDCPFDPVAHLFFSQLIPVYELVQVHEHVVWSEKKYVPEGVPLLMQTFPFTPVVQLVGVVKQT